MKNVDEKAFVEAVGKKGLLALKVGHTYPLNKEAEGLFEK